jgi:hypothetical protein
MPATKPLFTEEYLQDFLKTYTKEEQQLVQKDLAALLDYSFFKRPPEALTQKLVYLATAGGPGACKSTVLETYLRHNGLQHYVYTDPDQVALRKMNFTYRDWVSSFNLAAATSYKEALTAAYQKWRWASNYIAHCVFQEAFLQGHHIAHGTTSTGLHVAQLYEKLKEVYSIELLLCYAADETRLQTIQTREQKLGFVQADPKEVISKGKDFCKRFPIYFQYADKLAFYWQDEIKNGQLPQASATWERVTNQITVHHQRHWDLFCAQYRADLKEANMETPANLGIFFGTSSEEKMALPLAQPVIFRQEQTENRPEQRPGQIVETSLRRNPARTKSFKGAYSG